MLKGQCGTDNKHRIKILDPRIIKVTFFPASPEEDQFAVSAEISISPGLDGRRSHGKKHSHMKLQSPVSNERKRAVSIGGADDPCDVKVRGKSPSEELHRKVSFECSQIWLIPQI
ncbi:hypothetical protein NDU88_003747 [Pleurodeles waltl]|uniref:Uncharacterized protein n=1 Tax=Pleurodeles waltl TaxID=8319 RepID=A0AAV7V1I2_PLEWA|nr:hypothetical protein NDU88_003747 [Pleurodeles waltl]